MTEYLVEYAKSGRSTCKVCKAKIEQGALRFGTSVPGDGDYMMTSWRHLDCQKKPKHLADLGAVAGLRSLAAADQAKAEAWYASLSAGKSGAASKSGGGGSGGAAAGKKRAADDAPPALSADPKKMKAAELKAALKAHGLPTGGKKKEQVAALQEVAGRAAAEEAYGQRSVAELKAMCELNRQVKSGAKSELVDRCVDGKLYGALPRCPTCGGGTLRVRYASKYGHGGQGTFSCPGYYDDDCYKRCGYSAGDATRTAWQEA